MGNFIKRITFDALGVLLIILAVPIGWLPGPGGIPLALIGLGLLAKNNQWARNLMDNFEQKLHYYTDRLMEASPAAKAAIDLAGLALFSGGIYLALSSVDFPRLAGIAMVTTGFIIIILNRKRAIRLIDKITRKT